jgi:predicted nucleotidyltransferase
MEKLDDEVKNELLVDNTVLCGYYGSVAYGTTVSDSDIDLIGVYLAPVPYYVGLGLGKHYKASKRNFESYDITNYEFRKFIRLLMKGDPAALSLLWLRKDHYIERTLYGNTLINRHDLFLSKRIYNSFVGYAHSQFEQVKNTKDLRGKKRAKLIKTYGYDCKSAASCIRLLKSAIEIMETGKFNVSRKTIDSEYLMAIKSGFRTFVEIEAEIIDLFKRVEEAYKKCDLPEEPDIIKVESLTMSIILDYIHLEHMWQGT